jgi:hypothetical protein
MMLIQDLKPGSLKETRFLKKIAKKLGLKSAASWDRVLRHVQTLKQARAVSAGGEPGTVDALARSAPDLDAMLKHLIAMRPVRQGLRDWDAVRAVELPAPLHDMRAGRWRGK